MEDRSLDIIERERAFADLDHARDDFLDAFEQAPAESLNYKPKGDEYSIGYLLVHIATPIANYTALLDQMRDAGWRELHAQFPERPPLDIELDRASSLEALETAHDILTTTLRALTPDQLQTKAEVYFPGATNPYPTSGRDIMGWLTDHYREHIPHLQEMLDGWRKGE